MTRTLLALFLTAACATTLTPSGDAASASDAASGEACGALPEAEGGDACGGAPLCSARERVEIACELRRAIASRYVFFQVKPRMLSAEGRPAFDARRHLDACVEGERAIAVEEEPLRFYDRMRRCTAAFEDGHLLLRVPGGVPQVALGLELRLLADGKVYVANREPRLASALASAPETAEVASVLEPGTEVLEIDGRPVAEALAELARHVPASSSGARAERAVDALTRRDFLYPERPTATLTVSRDGARREVELRWWVAPGAERNGVAERWLRRTGVTTTELVDWRSEPRARWGGAPAPGLRRGDPILAAEGTRRLVEHAGDGGAIAARLGEAESGGRPFCYAQLLTFHTDTLAAAGEKKRPLPEVMEEFIRGCNERQLDLVLDLRQNEGGYLSHSSALAAMLLPPDGTAPGGALLLRATAYNERIYRERAPLLGGIVRPRRQSGSEAEHVLDSIRAARREQKEFTPAFLDGTLHPSEAVGGFGGKVVALVSPGCMSACERLAGLLRGGGHAVLVGGATEGAGGSQQEAKDLTARWTDRSGRLSVSIPNAAMGVQPAGGEQDTSAVRFFEALAFENRPVGPHVRYATSLDDLVDHNRGWRERAEAALRAPPMTSLR